jgi:hypothetical protein
MAGADGQTIACATITFLPLKNGFQWLTVRSYQAGAAKIQPACCARLARGRFWFECLRGWAFWYFAVGIKSTVFLKTPSGGAWGQPGTACSIRICLV